MRKYWSKHRLSSLVLVIVLIGVTACEEQAPQKEEIIRPVRALQVADSSTFERRWFSGRAKGTQEIDLSFRVSGPLIERRVDVGTRVEKDDIIARIDPDTFTADVERAKANLARAEATLVNAEEQLKRNQFLFEKGDVSEARLDRFLAAAKEARAGVSAETAALRRRNLDLNYAVLRAPFSGIVVKTYVENFQDVRAKQPIVRLVDNSSIEMVVDIPESLISQASSVEEIVAKFDAFPDVEIFGRIKEIGTEASETTRTFPVTLIMEQPTDVQILPGMAGRASGNRIASDVGQAQIVVPETAIFSKEDPTASFVWVFDEDTKAVSQREVTTGRITATGIQISDGLQPGEWLVTAGVNYLKEGQRVRILEQ